MKEVHAEFRLSPGKLFVKVHLTQRCSESCHEFARLLGGISATVQRVQKRRLRAAMDSIEFQLTEICYREFSEVQISTTCAILIF